MDHSYEKRRRMISSLLHKTSLTLKMIKFQHSIFALPFALSSFFVATQGQINWISLLWIILAMVTARNAAMSFNRIVDRDIDAQTPALNRVRSQAAN